MEGTEVLIGVLMMVFTIIVGLSLITATAFATHKMIEAYRGRLEARNGEEFPAPRHAGAR